MSRGKDAVRRPFYCQADGSGLLSIYRNAASRSGADVATLMEAAD